MPQLEKGGKWVFGWVDVRPDRTVQIPPEAWQEYGFLEGTEAVFLRGSATSGGFALGVSSKVPAMLLTRAIGRTIFGPGETARIPDEVGIHPGQRLLAVRGSGHALGLLTRGRIYELALTHPAMKGDTHNHRKSDEP